MKVIDFGFARSDMFPVDGQFSRSETYCGSYAYASPEILMGIPYIPQAADVWSMGIIVYVMASAPDIQFNSIHFDLYNTLPCYSVVIIQTEKFR